MPIISVENVSFSFSKEKQVLKNISLSIEQGEYVAIIGRNGSGKSTLAKQFNGLLLPDNGRVVVDGLESSNKANLFEIRKRVGIVFQNPDNQMVASIVEDDIAFGPENLGLSRKEIGERIDFALKAVDMEKFRRNSPERLSGGQKQRIAIAGVLALKPQVLILDEATSMLDPIGRKEVLTVAQKLNKENKTTIVAITHYMDEVLDADRVIVIDGGEIITEGTPREIFSNIKLLNEHGLELPVSMQIAEKLREKGIAIQEGFSTEQLVEAICRLK